MGEGEVVGGAEEKGKGRVPRGRGRRGPRGIDSGERER